MRRAVAAVTLLGMLGVAAELVLIEHFEGWRQWAPLAALGAGVGALAWNARTESRRSLVVLRLSMVAVALVGALGLYLHYDSNQEFQRELDSSLRGWSLLLASLRAHSPPSLAPAVLGLLATLGWIAASAHPRTKLPRPTDPTPRNR